MAMKKPALLGVLVVVGLLIVGGVSGAEKPTRLAEFLKKMKLEGQPVLIEFGIVECELSGKGLDQMIALQQGKQVPGLAFIRVEGTRKRGVVDDYYRTKAPAFPVHRDRKGTLATAVDATAIPTFLLVDKFGHVRYRGSYPDQLVSWAETLVAENQDPGPGAPRFDAKELDVNRLLADTKLPDLKGAAQPIGGYMGTNGLLVVFVDTKCPYSAKAMTEIPIVAKVLRQHRVNSVVLNTDDPKPTVQTYYASHKTGTPVVYDVTSATRKSWGAHSVPIVVLIKPDQTLAYHGKAVWADVGAAVEKAAGLAAGSVQFTAKGTRFG